MQYFFRPSDLSKRSTFFSLVFHEVATLSGAVDFSDSPPLSSSLTQLTHFSSWPLNCSSQVAQFGRPLLEEVGPGSTSTVERAAHRALMSGRGSSGYREMPLFCPTAPEPLTHHYGCKNLGGFPRGLMGTNMRK